MSTWDMRDLGGVIHPEDAAYALERARKKQARDPSALAHYSYRSYRIISKAGETRWVEQ